MRIQNGKLVINGKKCCCHKIPTVVPPNCACSHLPDPSCVNLCIDSTLNPGTLYFYNNSESPPYTQYTCIGLTNSNIGNCFSGVISQYSITSNVDDTFGLCIEGSPFCAITPVICCNGDNTWTFNLNAFLAYTSCPPEGPLVYPTFVNLVYTIIEASCDPFKIVWKIDVPPFDPLGECDPTYVAWYDKWTTIVGSMLFTITSC